jgi:hypothetical protein
MRSPVVAAPARSPRPDVRLAAYCKRLDVEHVELDVGDHTFMLDAEEALHLANELAGACWDVAVATGV